MKLHPYQARAVAAALRAPGRRWVFNDETGLGKTAEAIEAARCCKPGPTKTPQVLVICPALVRSNWPHEFDKWWPGHPEVGVIWAGARKQMSKAKRAALEAASEAPIQVVSYSLIQHARPSPWDVIILDEVHLLQSPNSGWSKGVRELVRRNRSAAVFGLTATLMPNRPIDFWNVGDILCPGRFGALGGSKSRFYANWKFCQRYTNPQHNGYGWSYHGVAEDTADELRQRIASMSSRTTKHEVSHLLPPFTVRLLQSDRGANEVREAVRWCTDALRESSHVAIMTHKRETARVIAEAVKGVDVVCLTGDDTPEERERRLNWVRARPSGVLVATMHSVGIGIDLTWCNRALFAELYWRPETIIQAIGRFSRLSGTAPSLVDFLVTPGSLSERIAVKLQEKLEAITIVADASGSEARFLEAVGETEEELAAGLREAVLAGGGELEEWMDDDSY